MVFDTEDEAFIKFIEKYIVEPIRTDVADLKKEVKSLAEYKLDKEVFNKHETKHEKSAGKAISIIALIVAILTMARGFIK